MCAHKHVKRALSPSPLWTLKTGLLGACALLVAVLSLQRAPSQPLRTLSDEGPPSHKLWQRSSTRLQLGSIVSAQARWQVYQPAGHANPRVARQQAQVQAGVHFAQHDAAFEPDAQRSLSSASISLSSAIIHSEAPFQPHMHIGSAKSMPLCTCACPQTLPPGANELHTLAAASHEATQPLPMPQRIARLHASQSGTRAVSQFGEVYVANLAERGDRAHYMCTILQQLQLPAVLWPAFPKRHAVVRAFAAGVKHARHNPLIDYWFLKPPPSRPGPPLATAQSGTPPAPAAVPAVKRLPGAHFRTPQIACYLTHREIWHNIAHQQHRQPVLVLEDDIEMETDFVGIMARALRELPSDWAFLWVGSCFEEANARTQRVGRRCDLVS